jgi:colanic acid biosynthesis glycosyl transferase WcaI
MDVGMLKNKAMIWLMEYIERQSYKNADHITAMSKTGKEFIVKRGGNPDKITCIYNSVNISDFELHTSKKDFKIKEGIEDKILVSYAGILSPFQGLDDILDAAKKMKEYQDVIFYLVGDGMVRGHLEDRVKNEGIQNAKIMPLQPRDEYFDIINSSDISIVSLDKRMSAPALPGKFINLLGVKQPIIANVPAVNDVAKIVASSNCGIVTEPGNIDQMINAIIKLKDDTKFREECGIKGHEFLETEMNLEKNIKKYEEIFESIQDFK